MVFYPVDKEMALLALPEVTALLLTVTVAWLPAVTVGVTVKEGVPAAAVWV